MTSQLETAAQKVFKNRELVGMILDFYVGQSDWTSISEESQEDLDGFAQVNQTMFLEASRIGWAHLHFEMRHIHPARGNAASLLRLLKKASFMNEHRMSHVQKLVIDARDRYWPNLLRYQFPNLTTLVLNVSYWKTFIGKLNAPRLSKVVLRPPRDVLAYFDNAQISKLKDNLTTACPQIESLHIEHITELSSINSPMWSTLSGARLCRATRHLTQLRLSLSRRALRDYNAFCDLTLAIRERQLKFLAMEMDGAKATDPLVPRLPVADQSFPSLRDFECSNLRLSEMFILKALPLLETCKLSIVLHKDDVPKIPKTSLLQQVGSHPRLRVLQLRYSPCNPLRSYGLNRIVPPITPAVLLERVAPDFPQLEVLDVSAIGRSFTEIRLFQEADKESVSDEHMFLFASSLPHLVRLNLKCGVNTRKLTLGGVRRMSEVCNNLKYASVEDLKWKRA